LDRAAQKAELQTAFAERFQLPPTPLAEVDPADSANRYRHVVAAGRYDNAHQLLLDNQVRDGRPGYHALTPLRLRDGTAILIDRGWLPLGSNATGIAGCFPVRRTDHHQRLAGAAGQPGIALGRCAWGDSRWPRLFLMWIISDCPAS
jgi:surfeit locus 1 family protein